MEYVTFSGKEIKPHTSPDSAFSANSTPVFRIQEVYGDAVFLGEVMYVSCSGGCAGLNS